MSLTVDTGLTVIKVTGTTDVNAVILTGLQKIKSVYWYNVTTAGDKLVLTDKNGGPIIECRAEADGSSQQWDVNASFDGVSSTDMDSGTLYIYR